MPGGPGMYQRIEKQKERIALILPSQADGM